MTLLRKANVRKFTVDGIPRYNPNIFMRFNVELTANRTIIRHPLFYRPEYFSRPGLSWNNSIKLHVAKDQVILWLYPARCGDWGWCTGCWADWR